jgi:hypothetical protein
MYEPRLASVFVLHQVNGLDLAEFLEIKAEAVLGGGKA